MDLCSCCSPTHVLVAGVIVWRETLAREINFNNDDNDLIQ